jgi:hypothetical protein
VILAEGTSTLRIKALSFKILFAHRAVETLTVVVVVKGFYPTVTSFYWEAAGEAFRREEVIPISFTIWKSFF